MKNTCRYATKYSNTACLNQPVVTWNSNNFTIVRLSPHGITCVAYHVFEFAAYTLLVLHLPFTVFSANVLHSRGFLKEVVSVMNNMLRPLWKPEASSYCHLNVGVCK